MNECVLRNRKCNQSNESKLKILRFWHLLFCVCTRARACVCMSGFCCYISSREFTFHSDRKSFSASDAVFASCLTPVNTVIWLMQHLVYKTSWIMQSWFLSSAQFMIGFWMFAGFHVLSVYVCVCVLRIDFCFHFVLFHSANQSSVITVVSVYYGCGCGIYSAPFHWLKYYSNDLDKQKQWTHTKTISQTKKYALE